ncbi:hypothetical protein TNCV_1422861 [Trichonephila clavipes]|nr:hypothetical protein TNCV_1422861 [Trichonephila clavipes]
MWNARIRTLWSLGCPLTSRSSSIYKASCPFLSVYFAHANVFHHQGKPVPIELSIATIPSDGSEPQVMGITVNHTGLTSTPHEIRPNSHEHERLRLVHAPLPKSVPVEYLPFCVRGKLSQMG